MSLKHVFVVALALALVGYTMANEIPPLCLSSSVTPVTCEGFEPAGDGLQPHPDNCQLFYYCVDAEHAPICRQCPAGLHFNPTLHVCDAREHAGCEEKDMKTA